ncbi:MAG: RHS repeat-associated core domain-containing protein [Myxococcota bacterium]
MTGDVTTATVSNLSITPPGDVQGDSHTEAFPLSRPIPPTPAFAAGAQDVETSNNPLSPGNYRDLVVGEGEFRLTSGVFNFRNVTLEENTKLQCDDLCEVRIENRFELKDGSIIEDPIVFFVNGTDGEGTHAVDLGLATDVHDATMVVPNGTIVVEAESSFSGHVIAADVTLESDVTFNGVPSVPLQDNCEAFCSYQMGATGCEQWPTSADCFAECTQWFAFSEQPSCLTQLRHWIGCWVGSEGDVGCNDGEPMRVYCENEKDALDECDSNCANLTNDDNACTQEVCNCLPGACPPENEDLTVHVPLPAGASCDDGNPCNGINTCNAGGDCVTSTPPVVVDDGDPCTIDVCNGDGSVTHTPVPAGTSCDDGNACNGISRCNASGSCVAGAPPTPDAFDDGNPCTADACDAQSGLITHTPVASGTSCSDGNACNGVETCNGTGTCAAGTPVVVDDGNPNTIDSCIDNGGVASVQNVTPPGSGAQAVSTLNPVAGTVMFLVDEDLQQPRGESKATLKSRLEAEPHRVSMVSGSVVDRTGAPVAFVDVHALDFHIADRNYGHATTRSDGTFDLVVLGGQRPLTLDFRHPAFNEIHRQIEVPPGTTPRLPDPVVMTPRGPLMSQPSHLADAVALPYAVVGAGSPRQVFAGELEDDAMTGQPSRARRPHLLLKPGTVAELVTYATPTAPEQRIAATQLHLREKEYTTEADGPNAMPAALPTNSAYTYAIEISADEAQAIGADSVEFINQPAVLLVDNFYRYPVGSLVPLGYYDRSTARWEAAPDGLIFQVLSIDGGLAALSIDGTTPLTASDYTTLGLDEHDRWAIGGLYQVGDTVWHIPVEHFTPIDPNGFPNKPAGACAPDDDDCPIGPPEPPGDDEPDPDCVSGSVVECQNQTLRQSVPIAGTPFSLNYRSDRTRFRKDTVMLRVPITGDTAPVGLEVRAKLDIAGRTYEFAQPCPGEICPTNLVHDFEWDGIDQWGRELGGPQRAIVRVGYTFVNPIAQFQNVRGIGVSSLGGGSGGGSGGGGTVIGYTPADYSFNGFPLNPDVTFEVPDPSWQNDQTYTVWRSATVALGNVDMRRAGLAGWSLSAHHTYTPARQQIYHGDGSLESATVREPTAHEIRFPPSPHAVSPRGVALGPEGKWLYIADYQQHCIRRLNTLDETFHVFAGTCTGLPGHAGDGAVVGSATRFNVPWGIAVDDDGTVYVSEVVGQIVRRIDGATGMVSTHVGAYSEEGIDPNITSPTHAHRTAIRLSQPHGISLAKDGTLYIADHLANRVLAVDPSGWTETRAGNIWSSDGPPIIAGAPAPTGVSADNVYLHHPLAVVALDDGAFVVSVDSNEPHLTRVANGEAFRIAGDGSSQGGNVGIPAESEDPHTIPLPLVRFLAATPAGELFLSMADVSHVNWTDSGIATLNNGILRQFSGHNSVNPSNVWFIGDGQAIRDVDYGVSRGVAISNTGSIYVADSGSIPAIIKIDLPFVDASSSSIEVPRAGGAVVDVFDIEGRHEKTVDTIGDVDAYTFAYDTEGRLATITDRDGLVTTVNRDANGYLTGIVGPFGHTTTIVADANSDGWITSVTNPNNEQWTMTYRVEAGTTTGLLTSFKSPGATQPKTYEYGQAGVAGGRLTEVHNPGTGMGMKVLSRTSTDTTRNVTHVTALGRTYTYEIETFDEYQEWTTTAATGEVTTSERYFDGDGNVTRTDGSTATLALEPGSWLGMGTPDSISVVTPSPSKPIVTTTTNSAITEAVNDANALTFDTLTTTVATTGEDAAQTQSQTVTRTVEVDHTGQLCAEATCVRSVSAENREATVGLDAKGRPRVAYGTGGLADVTYDYNSLGQLRFITAAPGSAHERRTELVYDVNGHLSRVIDPLLRTTEFTTDAVGRTTTIAPPSTHDVGMTYTADGLMDGVDPPGVNNAHAMTFDDLMQLTTYTPPAVSGSTSTFLTEYDYDQDRALDTTTLPTADEIDFVYNVSTGLLSNVVIPGPGNIGLSYGTGVELGKLKTITANGTTLTTAFDGALVDSVTLTSSGLPGPQTVSWTYDLLLRVASETAGGVAVDFDYDDDGLLLSALTGATPQGLTLTHDPVTGLPDTTAMGAGSDEVETTYGYNAFGEVVSMRTERKSSPVEVLLDITYARDKLGRVVYQTETRGTAVQAWQYHYNDDDHLVEVDFGTAGPCSSAACAPIDAYGYDPNGNRTHRGPSLGSLALVGTYDEQDRVLLYDGVAHAFDDNGMLETKGSGPSLTTFDYDVLGNLLSVNLPGGASVTYVVDGRGRRTARTYDDGQGSVDTVYWVYRDQLNPVAQLDANGNVTRRFVYADNPHVPAFMVDVANGNKLYRFVTDHLGSVRLLVDINPTGSNPAIVQEVDYDPWGHPTLITGTWDLQPFAFAGGLYDDATGLLRFGARDYDPETARWTAKDPSLLAGGLNVYEYAASDPVNLVDLTGLAPSQADLLDLADALGVGIIARGIVTRRDAPMAAAQGDPDGAAAQAACAAGSIFGGIGEYGVGSAIGAGIGAGLGVVGAIVTRGVRRLKLAHLGDAQGIVEVVGTLSRQGNTVVADVDLIFGKNVNLPAAIVGLKTTARAMGASNLRVQGTILNPTFRNALSARYNLHSNGGIDYANFPL